MRARSALPVVVAVLLAAALPAAAAASGGGGGVAAEEATGAPAESARLAAAGGTASGAPAGLAADNRTVTLQVQLRDSGDADWTVSTFVPLDGADDRAAFRDLGRGYVNGTVTVETDAETFRRIVAAASAAADRPMRVADVERDWAIRDGYGVLVLRFTWENFAREQDDRFVVDDAFRTSSGTWLPRLEAGQVLVIRPPTGVGFLETPRGKGVTNGTLRWEGPQTFGENYFRIVYRDEPGGGTTGPGNGTTPPPGQPGSPLSAGAFLVVSLLVGGAAGVYLWRRRDREPSGTAPDDGDTGPDVPAGTTEADGTEAGGATAGGVDADPADAEGAAPDQAPAEPTPEDPFAGVDVEMLSDEERVQRLLEAHGGRMKQAQIVKETDWSNAKVSQLLSAMDEEDAINKLRIGRENLISLPDVDLDSVQE